MMGSDESRSSLFAMSDHLLARYYCAIKEIFVPLSYLRPVSSRTSQQLVRGPGSDANRYCGRFGAGCQCIVCRNGGRVWLSEPLDQPFARHLARQIAP